MNNSKETKKTKRKRSLRTMQQMKLAIIMIMVSVLVLSASTFAWYRLSNTAKIQGMEFTADTLGNLQIANSRVSGTSYIVDGDYKAELDLGLDEDGNREYLMPTTTMDGLTFVSPEYNGDGTSVEKVSEISDDDLDDYVYEKVFFLLVGEEGSISTKKYDLKLTDGDLINKTGTYVLNNETDSDTNTAANAVRISFTFKNAEGDVTKIYEPNSVTENDRTKADYADTVTGADNVDANYGAYTTIAQKADGTFFASTDGTNYEDDILYEMTEGVPVQVTMYVWIEGTDEDCRNSIALREIAAQIQFEATPKAS
ncbi:MAG: hypothetical protein IJA32_01395 [Lachnospiraceae bacterium]|nr:hypothetical protein [Lachnospiraceae bacterium]